MAWAPIDSNPNVRLQINGVKGFESFQALACGNINGLWGHALSA